MHTKKEALERLARSRFRSSFHLNEEMKRYVGEKGMDVIAKHAREIVAKRIAPAIIENDGRQTPMKRHPVFIAQHATATCCRGCLKKWYRVEEGVELTDVQQEKIVGLIMAWIEREME